MASDVVLRLASQRSAVLPFLALVSRYASTIGVRFTLRLAAARKGSVMEGR